MSSCRVLVTHSAPSFATRTPGPATFSFRTAPVSGSIRETVSSGGLATHTAPPASTIAPGPFPTAVVRTGRLVATSRRITVLRSRSSPRPRPRARRCRQRLAELDRGGHRGAARIDAANRAVAGVGHPDRSRAGGDCDGGLAHAHGATTVPALGLISESVPLPCWRPIPRRASRRSPTDRARPGCDRRCDGPTCRASARRRGPSPSPTASPPRPTVRSASPVSTCATAAPRVRSTNTMALAWTADARRTGPPPVSRRTNAAAATANAPATRRARDGGDAVGAGAWLKRLAGRPAGRIRGELRFAGAAVATSVRTAASLRPA